MMAVISIHKLFWNQRLVLRHFKRELFESGKRLFKLELQEMENNKAMHIREVIVLYAVQYCTSLLLVYCIEVRRCIQVFKI